MPQVIFLGTSNAVPDKQHENTHLAVVGKQRLLLIDCVNNPIVRLQQMGVDAGRLTDLLLTHFHPDHVSGVPSLLMSSWLLGRTEPLDVYGLTHTLDRVERLMNDYEWDSWPNFYPVIFHRIPEKEMVLSIDSPEFRVYTSPVHHLVPNIGMRIEFPLVEKALAYSCDTEPCQEVVRLASGVDVLVHESAGATRGHSSAAQAGAVAQEAEVGQLYLIHYRTGDFDPQPLVEEARAKYEGPITLAKDFMKLDF